MTRIWTALMALALTLIFTATAFAASKPFEWGDHNIGTNPLASFPIENEQLLVQAIAMNQAQIGTGLAGRVPGDPFLAAVHLKNAAAAGRVQKVSLPPGTRIPYMISAGGVNTDVIWIGPSNLEGWRVGDYCLARKCSNFFPLPPQPRKVVEEVIQEKEIVRQLPQQQVAPPPQYVAPPPQPAAVVSAPSLGFFVGWGCGGGPVYWSINKTSIQANTYAPSYHAEDNRVLQTNNGNTVDSYKDQSDRRQLTKSNTQTWSNQQSWSSSRNAPPPTPQPQPQPNPYCPPGQPAGGSGRGTFGTPQNGSLGTPATKPVQAAIVANKPAGENAGFGAPANGAFGTPQNGSFGAPATNATRPALAGAQKVLGAPSGGSFGGSAAIGNPQGFGAPARR